ncbi:MAG TPA: hypothetical protein VJN93_03135 [Candidatus Acidoferrum sp.]|nr:hypothetical protein [Candidatus Acidoferrum sp.]
MTKRLVTRERLRVCGGALLLFFGIALTAHAQEGGGSPAAQAADQLFRWVNFVIIIGIVVWLCVKKVPSWSHANAGRIRSAITKATSAREEAERKVKEAEAKLAHLQQEIGALESVARQEATAESEHVRALTQSDLKKVAIAAEAEIEAAEHAARIELKALAASLAVDGAESLLVKQLTPAAQEVLVDSFVKSLEGRPN